MEPPNPQPPDTEDKKGDKRVEPPNPLPELTEAVKVLFHSIVICVS